MLRGPSAEILRQHEEIVRIEGVGGFEIRASEDPIVQQFVTGSLVGPLSE